MESKTVFTAHSIRYDITATVRTHEKGYAVSLRDNDAGETLPTIKIFPDKGDAIDYADNCTL